MKRLIKLLVPALAMGLFAVVPAQRRVGAADAPAATQPAAPAAVGTVSVRVVDGQGNPVEGATITIAPAPEKGKGKKADPNAVKQKPVAVAEGKTDAQGFLTLNNVPEGTYRATAKLKGDGTGHEDVVVTVAAAGTPAAATPPVTITLKAKKNAAPTSQPT